jgi:hypothetical protein
VVIAIASLLGVIAISKDSPGSAVDGAENLAPKPDADQGYAAIKGD